MDDDTAPATCHCGAPGEASVIDPDGSSELCALHAIQLLGSGVRVTLMVDVAVVPA